MTKKNFCFLVVAFILLTLPLLSFAKIGVGVGVGKIKVEQELKPGMIYSLPPLPVLNTGDEPSDYGVSVEYHEGVPQLRPAREWFSFNPQNFHLNPGEAKNVEVTLTLPVKTIPGDYFAYLEGHPIKKSVVGQTSIGVAAAARLYFTVVPANIFSGIYWRIVSFWVRWTPWTWIVLGAIILAVLIALFKKYFSFKIGIKKK